MRLYDVGKIVNTHGLKGELRVQSITDFPDERYSSGKILYAEKKGHDLITLTVQNHRKHKKFDLLTFEGYSSIDTAENLVGSVLKVSEEEQKELPENEFYYHQIIGASVKNEEGEQIGFIKEILSPGANDVWVVKRESRNDLLLPFIEGVILKVDLNNNEVTVSVPEGLDE